MCVCVCVRTLMQGLGLLINLVEYSSRNRHCLVELKVDSGCLPETVKDGRMEVEKEKQDVDKGMENMKEKSLDTKEASSALSALVQVCLQVTIRLQFRLYRVPAAP